MSDNRFRTQFLPIAYNLADPTSQSHDAPDAPARTSLAFFDDAVAKAGHAAPVIDAANTVQPFASHVSHVLPAAGHSDVAHNYAASAAGHMAGAAALHYAPPAPAATLAGSDPFHESFAPTVSQFFAAADPGIVLRDLAGAPSHLSQAAQPDGAPQAGGDPRRTRT